ncbi:MAG TPA: TIGR03435 family protein [Bryobacteraceae bacterium]|nr:TIGR03435 family protein [Bryobacteraceae bacterium]
MLPGTRFLLAAAVAACGVFGQSADAPRFAVASIKPNAQGPADFRGADPVRILPGGRLLVERAALRYFIQNAYGVKPFQLLGGPGWIDSTYYDIDAKAEGNPSPSEMRRMMQVLLEDRFHLKVRRETRQLPVYDLTVAKSGLKLPPSKPGSCLSPDPDAPPLPPAPGRPAPCGHILMMVSPAGARMIGGQASMAELVRILSNVLGRMVIDKTGFTGTFDVHLEFSPDDSLGGLPTPAGPNDPRVPTVPADPNHPTLFGALAEQFGIKVEAAKGPVEVIVIDQVERPSSN